MWLLLPVYLNTVSLVNYEASQVMVELLVLLALHLCVFHLRTAGGAVFSGFHLAGSEAGPEAVIKMMKERQGPELSHSGAFSPDWARQNEGGGSEGERKGERAAAHKGIWHFCHIHQDNSMAALKSNMIIFIFQPLALPLWAKVKWMSFHFMLEANFCFWHKHCEDGTLGTEACVGAVALGSLHMWLVLCL